MLGDEWETAGIVLIVEAEFGAIEPVGEILGGDAKVPRLIRCVIAASLHYAFSLQRGACRRIDQPKLVTFVEAQRRLDLVQLNIPDTI